MAATTRRSAGAKKAPTNNDEPSFLCPYCNKTKKKSEFYVSSDPMLVNGVTVMCKLCAEKIARNYNEVTKTFGECTKESVQNALERLDKPFFNDVWESSYFEAANKKTGGYTNGRKNVWAAYITTLSMQQYRTKRWRDGDLFTTYIEDAKKVARLEMSMEGEQDPTKDQEIHDEYEKNRKDIIRLLGYDPFMHELEADKPLLYSQLIGYLDINGDGNDDMMRTSSAITIVRGFLQQAKIDDKIARSMANTASGNNTGEIKTLLDSKQKISSTISQLAEDSCLSLRYNKNASKGENTWTGKIKKLRDLNLREADVNAFDVGTCEGMRQVADISHASIMKQIRLDENDYTDMIAQQRDMIMKLQRESDENREKYRILLQENYDLKALIQAKNIDISESLIAIDLIKNEDFVSEDGDSIE